MPTPISFLPGFMNPSSFRWNMSGNTQSFTSPLVGAVQTVEMPGARWYGSMTWDTLEPYQWRDLEGWKAQLSGAAGRFYFGPVHAAVPRGVATGTPAVNGSNQTGRSLVTDGWTPSQTGILKRGDYFHFDSGFGRELKIITADVNSDAGGNATLAFMPPIRTAPADNVLLTVNSPSCIMRLKDDTQGENAVTPPLLGGMDLEFVEAFQ